MPGQRKPPVLRVTLYAVSLVCLAGAGGSCAVAAIQDDPAGKVAGVLAAGVAVLAARYFQSAAHQVRLGRGDDGRDE